MVGASLSNYKKSSMCLCVSQSAQRIHSKISEVIKRRTKSENVSVEFDEEQGKTNGRMVAEAQTYGADKLWVVLKPIPVELDSDSGSSLPSSDDDHGDHGDDEPGAAGSSQGPGTAHSNQGSGKRPRA